MRLTIRLLTLTCALAIALSGRAAPEGLPDERREGIAVGHRTAVQSALLDEQRELLVYLPESYADSDARYPVLYLLDAENDFMHSVGIVEFLSGIDRIPELVVVGVVNTNRSRDLTPPSGNEEETAFWDEVGGAQRFRRVLREEIIPFVDRNYRTQPFRILRGQSFGGLFAVYDYMSAHPVFDAVLASSPAVGWNHGELLKMAPEYFAQKNSRPLYIASAGDDFPQNLESILEFARIADRAREPRNWQHDHFVSESHYSLHHRSTYAGLEFLYASWPVPPEVVESADFDAYVAHYAALSERYGYPLQIPMRSIVSIGNRLLRAQQFEKGISVFERALTLYGELPEAHWRVGEAYRLAGRVAQARPHFERAYELAAAQQAPDLADYEETLRMLDEDGRPSQ